jgi:murein DD-endopeptidase MepM/ murein hydrolase activator NlpD
LLAFVISVFGVWDHAAPASGAAVDRPKGPNPTEPAPLGWTPPGPPVPRGATPPIAPPLEWLSAAQTTGGGVKSDHAGIEQLAAVKASLKRAQDHLKVLERHVAEAQAELRDARTDLAAARSQKQGILDVMRVRAIRTYVGGSSPSLGELSDLLGSASLVDDARRAIYAEAAQGFDRDNVNALIKKEKRLSRHADAVQQEADGATRDLEAGRGIVAENLTQVQTLTAALTDSKLGGRIFPVAGAFDFSDGWNAFRADPSDHGHAHHATDIMSEGGTPVVAVESGTLDRIGWNRLGGWRLWIKGDSGAWYYYAHMRAYAPGLLQDMHVVAGQYLGRVGNTGNAQGGPTHLHFEVHINDGKKMVDPYPLLCLLAGAPVPPIPPDEPPPTTTTTTTVAPTTTSVAPVTTTTRRR